MFDVDKLLRVLLEMMMSFREAATESDEFSDLSIKDFANLFQEHLKHSCQVEAANPSDLLK